MIVIGLVEKDVLTIAAFSCPVLEDALLVDTMLRTETLPEYRTNCSTVSAVRQ